MPGPVEEMGQDPLQNFLKLSQRGRDIVLNLTNEARRKAGKKTAKRRSWISTGGIADPKEANAEFSRRIKGQCFCNGNCKCGKRRSEH